MNNLMHLLLPGSRESVLEGCTCPTAENHFGEGATVEDGRPQYFIDEGCPLHGRQRTYLSGSGTELYNSQPYALQDHS